MRYLILRNKSGLVSAGLVAGRGQTLEVREGPNLEGAKLMAYMRKILGHKDRPSPRGKKIARTRRGA